MKEYANDYDSIIRNNIRKRRKELGLRQSDLGNMIGVSGSAVSNWEKGKNSLDVENFFLLCSALDISADELVGRSSTMSLSEREKQIILAFRQATPSEKTYVMGYLRVPEILGEGDSDATNPADDYMSNAG